MKKILLVANVAKEHVLKFHVPTIKALTEDGWQVDVACGGKEYIPYCHHKYELPIDRSPFKTHFIRAIRQLRAIIEKEKYEVVYCHTEVGGIVARLAASPFRKKGLKVVKLDHGLYFYRGASWLQWLIHYPVDKCLSKKTDTFILINKEDYDLVSRRFRSCNTYLIDGIGIKTEKFQPVPTEVRFFYRNELHIPQDACVLIYFAEVSENKNQKYLIKGLVELLKKDKAIYLVLAGRDLTNGEMERYVKSLNVEKNVRLLGWRDDINNLYAMSDICTASSIREGFGINIVEAMCCGIPVIATNNRGHATIIRDGENGLLVKLDDVSTFVKAVIELKNNPSKARQLADSASKEINKYSSEVITKRLIDLLNHEIN